MGRTRTIYVLHFDPPYSAPIGDTGRVKTAGHYIGSTGGAVQDRVTAHILGEGSPLVRAAVKAGCAIILADTWPGGRDDEAKIKRAHNHARRCPICRARRESS